MKMFDCDICVILSYLFIILICFISVMSLKVLNCFKKILFTILINMIYITIEKIQYSVCVFFPMHFKQEGPRGPGSLTWGKGQRSQWSHL